MTKQSLKRKGNHVLERKLKVREDYWCKSRFVNFLIKIQDYPRMYIENGKLCADPVEA